MIEYTIGQVWDKEDHLLVDENGYFLGVSTKSAVLNGVPGDSYTITVNTKLNNGTDWVIESLEDPAQQFCEINNITSNSFTILTTQHNTGKSRSNYFRVKLQGRQLSHIIAVVQLPN